MLGLVCLAIWWPLRKEGPGRCVVCLDVHVLYVLLHFILVQVRILIVASLKPFQGAFWCRKRTAIFDCVTPEFLPVRLLVPQEVSDLWLRHPWSPSRAPLVPQEVSDLWLRHPWSGAGGGQRSFIVAHLKSFQCASWCCKKWAMFDCGIPEVLPGRLLVLQEVSDVWLRHPWSPSRAPLGAARGQRSLIAASLKSFQGASWCKGRTAIFYCGTPEVLPGRLLVLLHTKKTFCLNRVHYTLFVSLISHH